jgi:hypothetical protein
MSDKLQFVDLWTAASRRSPHTSEREVSTTRVSGWVKHSRSPNARIGYWIHLLTQVVLTSLHASRHYEPGFLYPPHLLTMAPMIVPPTAPRQRIGM